MKLDISKHWLWLNAVSKAFPTVNTRDNNQNKPLIYVALPEATPSPFGTATLLLAALGGQTRSAPRNIHQST